MDIFLVAYGKKSLEEIFNKNMAGGQKKSITQPPQHNL